MKIGNQWYWIGSRVILEKVPPEYQAQLVAEMERKLLEAATRKSQQDDSQKKGGSKTQPAAAGAGPGKGGEGKTTGTSGGG